MKRILLLGIILAICILAMPQGVLAANNAIVNANILSFTSFDVINLMPSPWDLVASGTTTQTNGINFSVASNSPWSVTVASDPTNGRMNSTLSNHQLGSALQQEQQQSGTTFVTATGGHQILHYDATPSNTPIIYASDIQQVTTYADERLIANGDVYRINLTYTLTQVVL